MEQANPGELPKRWRLRASGLSGLTGISAEELAALNTALELMRRDGLAEPLARLQTLSAKLRAMIHPEAARRIAPTSRASPTRSEWHSDQGSRMILARQTCFCGALRSPTIASSRAIIRRDDDDNSCSHNESLNCFGRQTTSTSARETALGANECRLFHDPTYPQLRPRYVAHASKSSASEFSAIREECECSGVP